MSTAKTSTLSTAIVTQLNTQIGLEAQAAANYLAMASWAEVKGYPNTAEFLYQHATEERVHMRKIVRYLNQRGIQATIPALPEPVQAYNSLQHLFETALQGEKKVTQAIHQCFDIAWQAKAHATCHFLQWFIAEQEEEELLMQQVLDIFLLIGTQGTGLYFIDQEIGKLTKKASE